jgi:hypothetical protein
VLLEDPPDGLPAQRLERAVVGGVLSASFVGGTVAQVGSWALSLGGTLKSA